jgi:transcription elongation factor Elf1
MHMPDKPDKPDKLDKLDKLEGTCPICNQGDVITITMSVSGSDLSFTTCHLCEAKWWYRDGEPVPLRSVIGGVIPQRR